MESGHKRVARGCQMKPNSCDEEHYGVPDLKLMGIYEKKHPHKHSITSILKLGISHLFFEWCMRGILPPVCNNKECMPCLPKALCIFYPMYPTFKKTSPNPSFQITSKKIVIIFQHVLPFVPFSTFLCKYCGFGLKLSVLVHLKWLEKESVMARCHEYSYK